MAASPLAAPVAQPPSLLKRRWPLLAAVLGLHLTADSWIGGVFEIEGDDYRVGLLLGTLFAQVTLLAVWTAWAPVSFFLRLAGGLLLTGLVSLTFAGCILRNEPGDVAPAIIYTLIFFGQWLLAQAPLWLARAVVGQRLTLADHGCRETTHRELQFGVRQLLMLTGCVAVLLGTARWMFSAEVFEKFSFDFAWLVIAPLFAAFNSLAPLPTIWAAFAPRSPWIWLAASAVYMAGVTVAEVLSFSAAFGPDPDWVLFAWLNTAFYGLVAGTLLAFRACGVRLRS